MLEQSPHLYTQMRRNVSGHVTGADRLFQPITVQDRGQQISSEKLSIKKKEKITWCCVFCPPEKCATFRSRASFSMIIGWLRGGGKGVQRGRRSGDCISCPESASYLMCCGLDPISRTNYYTLEQSRTRKSSYRVRFYL